jgi:hypothetical protein
MKQVNLPNFLSQPSLTQASTKKFNGGGGAKLHALTCLPLIFLFLFFSSFPLLLQLVPNQRQPRKQKQGCGSAPCLCPFIVATNGANDENDVNNKEKNSPHITLLLGKEPDQWWQLLLLLPSLLMQQKNKKEEEAKIKREKKEKGGWTL